MSAPRTDDTLVTRTAHRLRPDPSRTIARLFVPGQEMLIHGESRAMVVIERVLAMSDDDVEQTLADTLTRFSTRHRDLESMLERHFAMIAHRLEGEGEIGALRRRLIGAYFTQEYAVEAAALFNPSIVAHPDQSRVAAGELRFVMSVRAVGEGHMSCIEFRTGIIGADATVRVDPAGHGLDAGQQTEILHDRNLFRDRLAEIGEDDENSAFLWSALPELFSTAELDIALAAVARQHLTRGNAVALGEALRCMAASNYAVDFDRDVALSERVLWPRGPAEAHGMEDARFVRFVDDGNATYLATYTAFDGSRVAPHLLETKDFRRFTVSQLSGPSAKNKGMALFPRRVAGRYVALSRCDKESNAIAYSDDGHRWGPAHTVQSPARAWDLTQLGNCGSPIETSVGWLVLTHGVGPMREYAIGAVLLDLHEPERLISALEEPLLTAAESERDGYVPNVVYSCGALLHGDTVVLPYGCSDASVRIATLSLPALLERLASSQAC